MSTLVPPRDPPWPASMRPKRGSATAPATVARSMPRTTKYSTLRQHRDSPQKDHQLSSLDGLLIYDPMKGCTLFDLTSRLSSACRLARATLPCPSHRFLCFSTDCKLSQVKRLWVPVPSGLILEHWTAVWGNTTFTNLTKITSNASTVRRIRSR